MDENSSGLLTGFREAYRRETLSGFDDLDRAVGGWAQSLHNGFEIWWLAGMPIVLVFLLTLLSVSVVSGLESHKLKWELEVPVPASVWRFVARVVGGGGVTVSSGTKKAVALGDTMENLTVCVCVAINGPGKDDKLTCILCIHIDPTPYCSDHGRQPALR